MAQTQDEQPERPGPASAEAKPNRAGPKEPETIAASILPQRVKDRSRHPKPPEARVDPAPLELDQVISAAEKAVQTIRSSRARSKGRKR